MLVAKRWRTADGQWCVDAIRLSGTPDRRDGDWLRVRWRGYWKADVRTVAELARLVPLDQLAEAPLALGRQRWHRARPRLALWPAPVTGYGSGRLPGNGGAGLSYRGASAH